MRLFRVLFLAIAAFSLGPACAPRAPKPNPALWRISDADSTVWLFGTVHLLPHGVNWRTPRIDAALQSADILVLETDIGPQGSAAIASLTRARGAAPPQRTLSALAQHGALSSGDLDRLVRQARAAGLDPALLMRERPWLVALRLSLGFAQRQGQDAASGVETALLATARAAGKDIEALETPDQQIATLADLPQADEIAFLRATMHEIDEGGEPLEALDRAWIAGDAAALRRLTTEDIQEAGPRVYDSVITRRNAAWTGRIRAYLAGHEDVFIAVGAAHLVGPDSVVARLRAQGLAVEGP